MRSRSARIYHQVMAGHHPNTPAPTGPLLQKVNYRKVMEYWTPLLSWYTGQQSNNIQNNICYCQPFKCHHTTASSTAQIF